MPTYEVPGVYVEEISGGARPVQGVGTSTVGFVGVAPLKDAVVNELVGLESWTQFLGKYVVEVSGKGKARAEITPESAVLARAVYGFFLNGGRRCCVVNTNSLKKGLEVLEDADEVSIVVAPGRTDHDSYELLLSHCEKMKDRVAILDAPEKVESIGALAKELRPRESKGGFGAVYFPWIEIVDPLQSDQSDGKPHRVLAPPSGHVAGIYARVDAMRGVHKAPANETIRGALDVSYKVTREEQGVLNPAAVNCIRFFPSEGIRVFGARTLADSGSEWRYINVRRLLIMIEESISLSTRWAVFEPNDVSLWKSLRRDVGAFLRNVWREGGLMGATPEEAFFVKCDAETNVQEEIDLGRVNITIGVAPVKPAEFVIFRVTQTAGGAGKADE